MLTFAISNGSVPGGMPTSDQGIMDLFPAIIQCFSVILFGYVAGCFQILTSSQAKGLGIYVTQFALPAVFFKVMVTLDFGNVSWLFIGAVSLAKITMYFITFLFTLLLSRPLQLGMAGLLGTFTTQSNDVALGYPILLALFPKYANYIYLFAPAQLVFINPISMLLLEWHASHVPPTDPSVTTIDRSNDVTGVTSNNSSMNRPQSPLKSPVKTMCWKFLIVFTKVLFNPLVFMTIIGAIFNLILGHKIPTVVDKILQVMADSFAATALFFLGISMVGKMTKLKNKEFYIVFFILIAKLIFMPFLTREIVSLVNPGRDANETMVYSTVGFMYGALPTAPPVFLYASQYQIIPEVIAVGLVVGTFLSAPLMFLSARLVTLPVMDESVYDVLLESTSCNIAILSIVCCIWVFSVFVFSRRLTRLPHLFTSILLFHILISCLGLLIGRAMHNEDDINGSKDKSVATWRHYIQFVIFYIGVTGARCWTSLIALSLTILRVRSLCFLIHYKRVILLAGTCLPLLITGLLLILAQNQLVRDIDPAFKFGKKQMIMSLVVLIVNMFITMTLLIIQNRSSPSPSTESSPSFEGYGSVNDAYQPLYNEGDEESSSPPIPTLPLENTASTSRRRSRDHIDDDGGVLRRYGETSAERSTRDVWLTSRSCNRGACTPQQRRVCASGLTNYLNNEPDISLLVDASIGREVNLAEDVQYHRHTVLLIILLVSMFFGVSLIIWRLVNESHSGIYIELEFLDSVFNFGQGFMAFAVFGLDTKLIIIPCIKRVRKCFYGEETVHLPSEDSLDAKTRSTRTQFSRYHLTKCKADIATNKRRGMARYNDAFTGSELVSWLVKVGLASDRMDAVGYGHRLLHARVIHHVTQMIDFKDANYLYRFSPGYDEPLTSSTMPGRVSVSQTCGEVRQRRNGPDGSKPVIRGPSTLVQVAASSLLDIEDLVGDAGTNPDVAGIFNGTVQIGNCDEIGTSCMHTQCQRRQNCRRADCDLDTTQESTQVQPLVGTDAQTLAHFDPSQPLVDIEEETSSAIGTQRSNRQQETQRSNIIGEIGTEATGMEIDVDKSLI